MADNMSDSSSNQGDYNYQVYCDPKEKELEQGFDLFSKNLFGSQEVKWVIAEENKQINRGAINCASEINITQTNTKYNDVNSESSEAGVDFSECSDEFVQVEKYDLPELFVGKIRNFTDHDIVLTVLDEQFRKGSDLFKEADQIVLGHGQANELDLANDVRFLKSPSLQMLFGLQIQGLNYKYIVFARNEQFHIKKYRVANMNDKEKSVEQSDDSASQVPGAVLIQSYDIGSITNRCLNVQRYMIDDSEL